MKRKVKVSEIDVAHLKVIRSSVKRFIGQCAKDYDKRSKRLLDIAPQDYLGAKEFFKNTKVNTLDIDPKSSADFIADLCENNQATIPGNSFDYILCTEVLEHTLQPFNAVAEMKRLLKPKGLIFLTVPFNFRIHGPLPDCWRFTEHGLRALFRDFEIIRLSETVTRGRGLMPIHYQLVAKKKK